MCTMLQFMMFIPQSFIKCGRCRPSFLNPADFSLQVLQTDVRKYSFVWGLCSHLYMFSFLLSILYRHRRAIQNQHTSIK